MTERQQERETLETLVEVATATIADGRRLIAALDVFLLAARGHVPPTALRPIQHAMAETTASLIRSEAQLRYTRLLVASAGELTCH